ncbi:uncharacterized protein LOC110857431 isoform X2 [Folsomia candida]|uniref:uncharacterized protein LOC110857431 isoform X2 n=1 Tax=Folsomia candida TaxID=158441 RepID=UPI001604A9F3|nr:uncharacterized protein LOC110857431 isoform X2 [Folsomia candida]
MDQLLITALLVTIISICVFLVIGLLLWYCYRRCTRSSQDPHRPPTRRAYEYIFQSFRSQDRQWPRLLPPPARELREPLRGDYEYPNYANEQEHRHVEPVNHSPPSWQSGPSRIHYANEPESPPVTPVNRSPPSQQSGFSRGNYEDDTFGAYGWGFTHAHDSKKRYETLYNDYEAGRRHDANQSESDSNVRQAYEARKFVGIEVLRNIQINLVQEKELKPAIPLGDDTNIIIGVDATPHNIGGYFINLVENRGEFYSFPVAKLPWTLTSHVLTPKQNQARNPAEFEMKNLVFALYLWKNELRQNGSTSKVVMFTDNFDFNKKRTLYGIRAHRFVRHLQNCEGIQIQVRVRGTKEQDIEDHAKFVKPADDFSRKRFKEGRDFLIEYFGLTSENFTGSHDPPRYGRYFKKSTKAREQLQRKIPAQE